MTDPPVIADVALLVSRRFGAPLVVDQPGRLPRGRGRAEATRQPRRSSRRSARDPASTSSAPTASSRSARRCESGSPRRAPTRASIVVIPNWVDIDAFSAAPARQRLGARARARRPVRRHALGQHRARAEPRLADPRGDVPARPRRPADRADRRRRAARRAEGARAPARSRAGALLRLPAARGPARVAVVAPTSTSSGSPSGLSGYVVPSRLYGILAVGRPVIVGGGRRERDRAGRPGGRRPASSCRRVAPSSSPRAIRRAHDGELDLESMGRTRARVRRGEGDRGVAIGRYRRAAARPRRRRTGDREQTGRGRSSASSPWSPCSLVAIGRWERDHRADERGTAGCERVLVAIGPLDNPTLACVPLPDRLPVPRLLGAGRTRFALEALLRRGRPRRRGDRPPRRRSRDLEPARGPDARRRFAATAPRSTACSCGWACRERLIDDRARAGREREPRRAARVQLEGAIQALVAALVVWIGARGEQRAARGTSRSAGRCAGSCSRSCAAFALLVRVAAAAPGGATVRVGRARGGASSRSRSSPRCGLRFPA